MRPVTTCVSTKECLELRAELRQSAPMSIEIPKEESMNAPLRPMLLVLGAMSLGGLVVLKNAHASQLSTFDTASESSGAKDGGGWATLAGKDGGGWVTLAGKDGGSIELADKGKDGGSIELADKGKDGGSIELADKGKDGGSIELLAAKGDGGK
jgi:hypothetical protein